MEWVSRLWPFSPKPEFCPFCIREFDLRTTPFRCEQHHLECPPEKDEVYARHWGDLGPMGKVIPAGGQHVDSLACPSCRRPSYKRLCPECHYGLPYTLGRGGVNLSFAVLGARGAGKSHFVAVSLRELKERAGSEVGFSLEEVGDETRRRYRRQYELPIFQKLVALEPTKTAAEDDTVKKPLLYSFDAREAHPAGPVASICIYDTSGEDSRSEESMLQASRFLARTDGIVLLVDPLQIPSVRARLAPKTKNLPPQNPGTRPGQILGQVFQLIERARGAGSSWKVPLAVALTKLDVLLPLFSPDSRLARSPRHQMGFDDRDYRAVSREVLTFLSDHGESTLLERIARSELKGFFALSSLGVTPTDGRLPYVAPHRATDPLLWLFAAHGLIPPTGGPR